MSPSVSVVVPAFNCAGYIGSALESVMAQSVACREIVVVDDGSSDATPEILAGYGQRIRVVRQENQGVAAARNRAIEQAQCEWIAFLDSDDVWHPEKVALQFAALAAFPDAILLFSDFRMIDAEGGCRDANAIKTHYGVFRRRALDWGDVFSTRTGLSNGALAYSGHCFRALFQGNFIKTSTVMMKRQVLAEVGTFDPQWRTEEDYDLWLRAAAVGPMVYLDQAVVDVRRRSGQLTAASNAATVVENAAGVVLAHEPLARQQIVSSEVDQRLAELHRILASVRLFQGKHQQSRQAARKALEFGPISGPLAAMIAWSYLPALCTRMLLRVMAVVRSLRRAGRRT